MKIDDAINNRYSVRSFLDKPVDRTLIEDVLSLAVRSPSWGNTQPWELAVIGGDKAKKLTQAYCDHLLAGVPGNPDFTMPDKFHGAYSDRYRAVGKEVFRIKGIAREDQEARLNHAVANFAAFGAPNLVYIIIDSSLETVYSLFDCGLLAAHISLVAASRSLGTCLLAALTMYPDDVREMLAYGPEKKVVLGMAVGYPDTDAPINHMRTPREPLEKSVTWIGME